MPVQVGVGEDHQETGRPVPGVHGKGRFVVMADSSNATRTLGFTVLLCLLTFKQPQINIEMNPSGVVREHICLVMNLSSYNSKLREL